MRLSRVLSGSVALKRSAALTSHLATGALTCSTHGAITCPRRAYMTPSPILRQSMPLPKDQADFSAYTEIDLPSESRIESIRKAGIAYDDWVALEKVHGTNFGIYLIDEQQVRFSKRSGIMDPHEVFFGYHLLIDEFTGHIRQLCELIKQKYGVGGRMGRVVMNGELFGGRYTHPLVPKSTKWCTMPNGKKFPIAGVQIQREPFPQYSPELHFFAFDLKYSVSGAEEDFVIVGYDDFVDMCSKVPGLLYAKPIVRGTLDDCLAFDVENFITPLPALLGLGNYPLEGNLAEGVVIRHVRRGQKDVESKGVSTIIKLRCSSFMELKHPGKQQELKETFIDTVRKAAVAKAGERQALSEVMLPEVEAAACALLINNVSDGRLSNVMSKIGRDPLLKGEVTKTDAALLLAKDALKDFLKETDPLIINTSISFRKVLITRCYHESAKLVNEKYDEFITEAKTDVTA